YNSSADYAALHGYTVLLVVLLLMAAVIVPLLPGVCESRLKTLFIRWLSAKTRSARSGLDISKGAMLLAVACSATILVFSPAGLTPIQARAAALTILVIGFWATSIIPPYLPAFILFVICTLFKIAPTSVVFSGFSSAALWLIYSGLILGVAIQSTGLGDRIARKVASLLIGREYKVIIGGVTAFGVLLAFIMPSAMGRIVLLIPIALALANRFGFAPGSNGRKAMVLAATFGSSVPAFAVLPSNVPNMVLAGTAETIYNISPLYGEYLFLHFPILGIAKAALIAYLAAKLFPDQVRIQAESVEQAKNFSGEEKKLTVILLVLLVLWMTDFAHHISPAWVALAACVLMLIPKHGLVTGKQFNEKINYGSLFFVAGVLGLGALVSHTGLGNLLARALTNVLPLREGHSFLNYLSLAITSTLTGVATTVPGVPAVLTPLADGMAQASGLSIKTILMSQVLGFSTVIFPYQAPPLIVGIQLAGESLQDALKLCLLLAVLTVIILLPINYIWWIVLGWL
ncbi:MAG: SLC13 family permease, partial [Desulfobulbaceae bacterium]|nr:SLC13 family permease [Desulfobulbaceae bacterium]